MELIEKCYILRTDFKFEQITNISKKEAKKVYKTLKINNKLFKFPYELRTYSLGKEFLEKVEKWEKENCSSEPPHCSDFIQNKIDINSKKDLKDFVFNLKNYDSASITSFELVYRISPKDFKFNNIWPKS